jgi:hypothetical protein
MTKQLKFSVYTLFAILGMLALAWIFGVTQNWQGMIERPTRAAYFLCDVTLVIPLGVIAGVGVLAEKRWARYLFVFVLGALLFDTAHQVYYLIWDNYFGAPMTYFIILYIIVAAYCIFTFIAVLKRRLFPIL